MLKLEKEEICVCKMIVVILTVSLEGEVLLLKSLENPDDYFIPYSEVCTKEPLKEVVKQKMEEMTSLQIQKVEEFFYEEEEDLFDKTICFYFISYLNEKEEKERVFLNEKADEFTFEEIETALSYSLDPFAKKAIERYKSIFQKTLTIGFKELSIDCLVGKNPDEKFIPQEIFIDLEAVKGKEPISYEELVSLCKEVATSSHHLLLEDLGEKIANKIFKNFHPRSLELVIRRPLAILGSNGSFIKIKKEG